MQAYIGMITISCCVLMALGQGGQEGYPSSRGQGASSGFPAGLPPGLAGHGGLSALTGGSNAGLASLMAGGGGGGSSMSSMGGLGGLFGGGRGMMSAALLGLDMNSMMEMQMCRQMARYGGSLMQQMCIMRVLN